MNKHDIEIFLNNNGYHAFYSDNYWIKNGESDYSGVTLCQAYIQTKYPELSGRDLFDKVMELEFNLNKNNKLGIFGRKTFDYKNELKHKYKAKWNTNKKCWAVDASFIKDHEFHDYCYSHSRNFKFQWIKNE